MGARVLPHHYFHITTHKSMVYRLLQRHQWGKRKPRPKHPSSEPNEQQSFKATFEQQVRQLVRRSAQDTRPLLVMASDEGRFGRIGGVHPCCVPPVSDRPSQFNTLDSTSMPMLLLHRGGKMSCLILPYVNTNMMSLFLKQVSADFADYFIILQVDRAAWHRAKNLQVPENIRLLPQPPYSPEVMPVEHIWDEVREKQV